LSVIQTNWCCPRIVASYDQEKQGSVKQNDTSKCSLIRLWIMHEYRARETQHFKTTIKARIDPIWHRNV
jgi:hypothetical protein